MRIYTRAQTAISTKFDIPKKVHETEEFPYVMHKMDSFDEFHLCE